MPNVALKRWCGFSLTDLSIYFVSLGLNAIATVSLGNEGGGIEKQPQPCSEADIYYLCF